MAEKKPKPGTRIPASELTSVKNWHLPRVNSGHVVRSPFQEKSRDSKQVEIDHSSLEVEPLTVEAIERIRQQAHEEGYKAGFEQGLSTGLEEGRVKGEALGHTTGLSRAEAEINALKAKLQDMMNVLAAPLQQQQNELEQTLLRLVIDAAEAVTKAELSTRPELLQRAIDEVLQSLPHGEPGLTFTINPDDLELLESLRDKEQSDWNLRTDEAMSAGGLLVKGINSYVDYSVEGRFRQVVEQLLASAQEQDESASSAPGEN